MPLIKQAIPINFARGLDTKTDPKQLSIGSFLSLQNSVFSKAGLLQKRNGYAQLAILPAGAFSHITTAKGNLTALSSTIAAYNASDSSWVTKGTIQPLSLSTQPLLRNNLNQISSDSATAPNGLVCTVYQESNGAAVANKYVVASAATGQNIIAPTTVPAGSGTVSGGMRVVVFGNYFVVLFTNTFSGTSHLQFITINISDPTVVGAATSVSDNYQEAAQLSWDAIVVNNQMYVAFSTASPGQAIEIKAYTQSLQQLGLNNVLSGAVQASAVSISSDVSNSTAPIIYVNWLDSTGANWYSMALDQFLGPLMSPVTAATGGSAVNIASAAQNGTCQIFYETANPYSGTSIPTNFVSSVTVTQATSAKTAAVVTVRSVGLASKAFVVNGTVYVLTAYSSPYQPTYFLVSGASTSAAPVIASKLAYSNGGGYLTRGLPSVTVTGDVAQIAYLFKDLIQSINKDTNLSSGTQIGGIYSQTGINLASFTINTDSLDSAEIGNDLHISGGFLWMYDGYLPVEHNFFLWPDVDTTTPNSASAVWHETGGHMAANPEGQPNAKAYFYQFVYEWTDNQGNAFRSAPSMPIAVTPNNSGGASTSTAGSVTLSVPTLRLTMKTANPVKLVAYRWSAGQPNYYQTTSINAPYLNDPTVDIVSFLDTNSDATILGNNLIYTTGGVIEDVNAPASNILALFDTRLWLVDAEDPNLLWFSKQVIEATPVEMSDLLTTYISPTQGVEGSTGPITALSPLDDKLIIFKRDAIYYLNGTGPDNTGANSQFSPASFITSTVGCAEQRSIVLMPQGLMFQSDKGIWLLDRGLNTSYIGAPVEAFNSAIVESAQNIPGTNQVRFILDSGVTLMYDYYFGQWGTFVNVPAVSACIYQNLHTFIDSHGRVYQENPGSFLDGSSPVLMQFQTGPIRLGDLQNYQRAYAVYMLGEFLSPHTLTVGIAYEYSPNPSQSVILRPANYSPPYGSGPSQSPYGQQQVYGGPASLEQFRIFLATQRCQAFSLTFQEVYDVSMGVTAGGGLTISGLSCLVGMKSRWPTLSSSQTVG